MIWADGGGGPDPQRRPNTQPRRLGGWELHDEQCPRLDCRQTATLGELRIEDRGPFQQISIRTFRCPDGHMWSRESDGG